MKRKYVIGEVITEYVKSLDKPFRIYAADHDMGEIEFSAIRNGRRVAAAKKLKTLVDIEILDKPVKDEIKELIDGVDTETAIDVYNLIYNREILKK